MAQHREAKTLSIVIPCYNEMDVLPLMFESLNRVLDSMPIKSQVSLVDDGSTDATRDIIRELSTKDARYTGLFLSRNYGHQIALTAGLDYAQGDVVVVLDADLQDPPELLPTMLEKWKKGYDVVYGKRTSRHGETWLKKATASMFYWVIRKFSGVAIPSNVGDFRLMDRKVVDALKRMPERFRFIRGLVVWAGFTQALVPYERPVRARGTTKYPLRKMIGFAFDAIFSFSVVPLRMASYTGALVVLIAAGLIARTLYLRFIVHSVIPGFSALYVMMLLLGGLNLIVLGILGEYIGRMYVEIKGRPLYFLEEIVTANR